MTKEWRRYRKRKICWRYAWIEYAIVSNLNQHKRTAHFITPKRVARCSSAEKINNKREYRWKSKFHLKRIQSRFMVSMSISWDGWTKNKQKNIVFFSNFSFWIAMCVYRRWLRKFQVNQLGFIIWRWIDRFKIEDCFNWLNQSNDATCCMQLRTG